MKKIGRKFMEEIYVILDNHRSITSNYTRKRLDRRIRLIFLPYNAPKLNRIEDEFSLLQREVLSNRRFRSEKEMIAAVKRWVDYRMGILHAYKWE